RSRPIRRWSSSPGAWRRASISPRWRPLPIWSGWSGSAKPDPTWWKRRAPKGAPPEIWTRRCGWPPTWPTPATRSFSLRERPASISSSPMPTEAIDSPRQYAASRRSSEMTANVTSIARIRTAARQRAERARSNSRTSTVLLLVTMMLVVIGLGETMSASSTVGIHQAADRFHFFKRQLLGVGIGLVVMAVASRVPYRIYRKAALPIFLVTLAGLVAVLAFGTSEGGAQRWLVLGPLNFQPSELAKFGVIVMLALLMERKAGNLETWGHFLTPVFFVVGSVAALVMAQPDLGTTILIGAVAMVVLWVSPAPGR